MGKKENDIINLRNEGMAYALRIAKKSGIEELERQVKMRGYLKCSVRFTAEELQQSIDNIADRVYNNMLTMVYAVMHDQNGWGRKRLLRFKEEFDRKVYEVGETDEMGRHWARFEDYASEANELYGLGIDMDKIRETQTINDEQKYIAADAAIGFLENKGYVSAAEALRKEVYERYGND